MQRALWAVLLFFLVIGVAHASRFGTVNYECKHLNRKTDGIGCRVIDLEQGPTLQIKIYDKEGHWRDRTTYVIGVITHNFLAFGGIWTEERATRSDGQLMQRSCPRAKNRNYVSCYPWYPAKP